VRVSGTKSLQTGMRYAHRGWNRHPDGGRTAFGTSPSRILIVPRCSGSGDGELASRATV
jgi:hypothetical protein